jgi:phosphoribosylformimino-5-aminoimidazole carboxamide ribotide isomerase
LRAILARHPFAISAGGGIRRLTQARELLEIGVRRLVIGTIAIRSPDVIAEWIRELGPEHFAIGLDLKNGELATDGWTSSSPASLESLVHTYGALGVRLFLCTDISRDGTLAGPNLALYHDLRRRFPAVEWIASGGVGSLDDLKNLATSGVTRAVVGKALYEGQFTYREAIEALEALDVTVSEEASC